MLHKTYYKVLVIVGTRLSMCRSIISFKENNTSDEGSGFAGCNCRGALKKNWKRKVGNIGGEGAGGEVEDLSAN